MKNKFLAFDEDLNVKITNLAYAIAEKRLLLGVLSKLDPLDPESSEPDLFDRLNLRELIEECFEEALEEVVGV